MYSPTKFDHSPLTDPKHAMPREEPRSVNDIIHEQHLKHMKRIDQAGWLRNLLQKADLMKAEQKRAASRSTKTTGKKKK